MSIAVGGGMNPAITWTPERGIGRITIREGTQELWAAETDNRVNFFWPPIRYGVHPLGAAGKKSAIPLTAGRVYEVSLFRWKSMNSEELQPLGSQLFILSLDSKEEIKAPTVVDMPKAEIVTSDEPQQKAEESESRAAQPEGASPEEEDSVDVGERPALRTGILADDFRLDGAMDEPSWVAADAITDLKTIEPEEGGTPEGRAVIRVLANQNEVVVGARCYDNDPEGIVSYSKARDSELGEEDHLLFVLDTFLDGRSGYVFAVNPAGARFDGLVEKQGEDVNSDWDAIWEAKTTQDDSGWCAEIRIPIKSLGFKKDLTTWGFNVQRRVQRLQETSRWSSAKRDYDIYQTSRAGQLTDLPEFDFGVGLSVRPSVVGRMGTPSRGVPTDFDGDASLDITQKLGPNLLSALTVNTDFAETEVDVRQINVTRFPLFFPEKRTFFLEGADIFDFGVGLDEEKLVPFFSRRIGLLGTGGDDQSEIPINVGGKINGRVGETNIGALVVNTRTVDGIPAGDSTIRVPQTTMGAVRVRQNVLEESSVGMLATFGDQQNRSRSWSAGLDFTFRTSSFMDDKNFILGVWGMLNGREDLQGDKSAFGFKIDYPNDLLSVNLNSIRLGDGFDPSLGFIPRNNLHIWEFSGEYKPRPESELIRQLFFDLTGTLYNTRNNSRWESYDLKIKPLSVLFESGDRVEFSLLRQGDRPPTDFEISTDVDIPAASYEWTRYTVGLRLAEKRAISGELLWAFGDYYNGNLKTLQARLTFRPSAFLALEITGEKNTGKVMAIPDHEEDPIVLVQKSFTEELYGFRVQLNFSPDLQFSSLTQYDTQSKELGSNNKLRWTFDPLGDIFIVYNHKMVRNADNRWEFVSNQLPIKIQYAWRF